MRQFFILLLFSVKIMAQKTETIDLSKSIKNGNNSIKTFTVIDQRPNQDIGSVTYHKDQVNVVFENNAAKDIKNWFYKYNPVRGNDELVLLLEHLNISEDKKEKYSIGKLELRASTFIKKDDGYHFLYRKDTTATVSTRNTPYVAQSLAKKVTVSLTELLKESYKSEPWKLAVSESELPNYANLLKDKLEILKTDNLKEGVYKDSYSFFTHSPEPEFTIQANDKGVATKAVKGEEKTPIRKFYAFVHNGIPYKVIPVGYAEIFRNEKGLFIEAKKEELFPETASNGAMVGGAAGGLIGSLIGAAIDASVARKRRGIPGSEVYLDPLTGNYILPENFGKSK